MIGKVYKDLWNYGYFIVVDYVNVRVCAVGNFTCPVSEHYTDTTRAFQSYIRSYATELFDGFMDPFIVIASFWFISSTSFCYGSCTGWLAL